MKATTTNQVLAALWTDNAIDSEDDQAAPATDTIAVERASTHTLGHHHGHSYAYSACMDKIFNCYAPSPRRTYQYFQPLEPLQPEIPDLPEQRLRREQLHLQ